MQGLLQLDKRLFLYLNHLGNAQWDGFWLFVTAERSWIPLYGALILLSIGKLGWKRGGLAVLFALALFGFTDQLTNLIKIGFQRLRPCYDPQIAGAVRLVRGYCGGKYGFTSGHAGNAFAFATFMTLVFRRTSSWVALLLLWAALVAYSRIYVGVHFPLDSLGGAFLGIFFAFFFYRLYQRFWRYRMRRITSRA